MNPRQTIALSGLWAALLAGEASAQVVRDDFDPARFREDLLLIQPVFTPPELLPSALPAGTEPVPARAVDPPLAVTGADSLEGAFRVQVIALSREAGARGVAERLARQFSVPVSVESQGALFAVRAGRFSDPGEAGRLKAQIALLSDDYAGAFVVSDTLAPADDAGVQAWIAADDEPVETAFDEPVGADPLGPIEVEMVRIQGWRVLLGQYFSLEGAQDFRAKVMARLDRDDVDITFEEPWYKVLAGNFRTSTEAQQYVDRCRRLGYRSATRIPAEVEVPKEARR